MSRGPIDLLSALACSDLDSLGKAFKRKADAQGLLERIPWSQLLLDSCPRLREQNVTTEMLSALFYNVDGDSDGRVTWEETHSFATDTAASRLHHKPAEHIQPYVFTRRIHRDDNVLKLDYLTGCDRIMVSSRHNPLQLMDPFSGKITNYLKAQELPADVTVSCIEYLRPTNSLVTFASDMRLRVLSASPEVEKISLASEPYLCDYLITRMKARSVDTTQFYASTRSGTLQLYDTGKNNNLRMKGEYHIHHPVDPSSAHYRPHSPPKRKQQPTSKLQAQREQNEELRRLDLGREAITDFCFLPPGNSRVCTAALDHSLAITDLESSGGLSTTLLGTVETAVTRMIYQPAHSYIVVADVANEISAWVSHQSHNPMTRLLDVSRPHRGTVLGLHTVPGTPQVLSVDVTGMIKVWDLRMFRCAQTLQAGTALNDVTEEDGDVNSTRAPVCASALEHYTRNLHSICFAASTGELVCAESRGLLFHSYDRGLDPTVAANIPTVACCYNAVGNAFLTATARELSTWDIEHGTLDVTWKDLAHADISAMTIDRRGRRVLVGYQDGTMDMITTHGGALVKRVKNLHHGEITAIAHSDPHRQVVSVGLDGAMCTYHEQDQTNPITRVRFSTIPLVSLALQPALSLAAVGSAKGRVYLMDLLHARTVVSEEAEHIQEVQVTSLCFLGSFPLFAAGYSNGDVYIWSCRPARETRLIYRFHVDWKFDSSRYEDQEGLVVRIVPRECRWKQGTTTNQTSLWSEIEVDAPGTTGTSSGTSAPAEASPKAYASFAGSKRTDSGCFPSTMQYDEFSHILWIGDSTGDVVGWKLCPIYQALDLKHVIYPGTPLFDIRPVPKALSVAAAPILCAAFKAHRDEVFSLELVGTMNTLISSGDDKRVLLWNFQGECVSELSMGRLPEGSGEFDDDKKQAAVDRKRSVRGRFVKKIEAYRALKGCLSRADEDRCCQHPLPERSQMLEDNFAPFAATVGSRVARRISSSLGRMSKTVTSASTSAEGSSSVVGDVLFEAVGRLQRRRSSTASRGSLSLEDFTPPQGAPATPREAKLPLSSPPKGAKGSATTASPTKLRSPDTLLGDANLVANLADQLDEDELMMVDEDTESVSSLPFGMLKTCHHTTKLRSAVRPASTQDQQRTRVQLQTLLSSAPAPHLLSPTERAKGGLLLGSEPPSPKAEKETEGDKPTGESPPTKQPSASSIPLPPSAPSREREPSVDDTGKEPRRPEEEAEEKKISLPLVPVTAIKDQTPASPKTEEDDEEKRKEAELMTAVELVEQSIARLKGTSALRQPTQPTVPSFVSAVKRPTAPTMRVGIATVQSKTRPRGKKKGGSELEVRPSRHWSSSEGDEHINRQRRLSLYRNTVSHTARQPVGRGGTLQHPTSARPATTEERHLPPQQPQQLPEESVAFLRRLEQTKALLPPSSCQVSRQELTPSPRSAHGSRPVSRSTPRTGRVPLAPKGLTTPHPPSAPVDYRAERLADYETELKRCIRWNRKNIEEQLVDEGVNPKNWATGNLRGELFHTAVMQYRQSEQPQELPSLSED